MTATVGQAAALAVAAVRLVATRSAAVLLTWAGSRLPVDYLLLLLGLSHIASDPSTLADCHTLMLQAGAPGGYKPEYGGGGFGRGSAPQ